MEKKGSYGFKCKDANFLTDGSSIRFNSAMVSKFGSSLHITHPENIQMMSVVDETNPARDAFISRRARGSSVAAVCRPDLSFGSAVAA